MNMECICPKNVSEMHKEIIRKNMLIFLAYDTLIAFQVVKNE